MGNDKCYDNECPPPYSVVNVQHGTYQPGGVVNVAVVDQPCVTHPCTPVTPVVVMGALCPACQVGILQEEFTGCGICLGICFFPLGLVCCMLMRERRCNHCRATFS